MSITLGVVMDPIEFITPYKDTTLAMLLAAQARGWTVYCLEQQDLYVQNGRVHAHRRKVQVFDDNEHWFKVLAQDEVDVAEFDVILMRKDPPVNMDFTYTTHLLELAAAQGVYVSNRPDSIRNVNEKLSTLGFPDLCPPTLVTASEDRLKSFIEDHADAIIKPLNGMGGSGIFRLRPGDPNLNSILEHATAAGTTQIMAQRYVPEIADGDKRVLVINGQTPAYLLARIPAQGETRGNLAAGGRGVVKPVTDVERRIVDAVSPFLLEHGLLFVGLDVIGSYLTEINVTSPTCAREIDAHMRSVATTDDSSGHSDTHASEAGYLPGLADTYLDAVYLAWQAQQG